MHNVPQVGDFVRVRTRRWLVEGERSGGQNPASLNLACVEDDAQGEAAEIIWDAELDAEVLGDEGWDALSRSGTDDPSVFAAYIQTLRWNSVTAADRDLFQAPFRAGIRLDAYQLLPLRKALRLPRVNLLIADDVGAGKTVEAGLVLREMLLRRRVDFVVVAAPAGMVRQWQDELEAKFGLTFQAIDREQLALLRRDLGFGANPWASRSRFVISHSLLADETYMSGLRDLLGSFRPRAMLILDEAHHAAPANGSRYAIDSQFTKAVRELASRFEHRLLLSATPHNGHSNSFSSLLEILDPQRFTRGVPVRPRDLDPVMVRRLKADLRHFGERFPARVIEPIRLAGLPQDAPELVLPRMLAAYGETIRARAAGLPPREAGNARLAIVGLQQRLLSSIAAFAHTLEVHHRGLHRAAEGASVAAARAFVGGAAEAEDEPRDEAAGEAVIDAEERQAAEAAAMLAAPISDIARVEAMLALAKANAHRPDARAHWLTEWVKANLAPGGRWNNRRLVLFTEYEDTRRWLQKRLAEALDDLAPDDRIAAFTGATPIDRREELKRRFNADPATDPLRILICTDAAREGINLQSRCHDLIHIDLPWNPARLEQRNGRIDRKLQPSPTVWCRYFLFEQREEDIVLEALVRKTELIREQLGSAGQIIAHKLTDRLEREGIVRPAALAREVADAGDDERVRIAVAEMDDETVARRARQAKELDELRKALERSRERVGVDPDEMRDVVGTALTRVGLPLDATRAGEVGGTALFRLDAGHPAFQAAGWPEALDDLRIRRRGRNEKLKDWRATAPLRAVAFRPAVTEEGADAEGVVQLHLEHRLVRRLLSRFLSQGFQAGLSRASVVVGPGAQPRVVLLGRLALYGPSAARLHEEIIPVTAAWTEAARGTKPLRAFGTIREEATLDQLEEALRDPRRPADQVANRIRTWAAKDASDLEPELHRRAAARKVEVARDLAARGDAEASSLLRLLEDQRSRIAKVEAEPDDQQLRLFPDAEADQRRRDRRHWRDKLDRLSREIEHEPARVREGYAVRADRIETVGLLYLWPGTG
ncbi:DISARM system SNF2-like helicase DrmD [Falsiroseomonas sp. HC035]|uniref:DISARM system SNF2-like helicase DrmD n=1 Tax=Falsiroseomonas sp. HC035 TaxID=3390999 RepID=UPI003D313FB6